MTRIQEETVTSFPIRIHRVILKIFRVKHIDEISSTHGATRVS